MSDGELIEREYPDVGPIADDARAIASWCAGRTRINVYKSAKRILTARLPNQPDHCSGCGLPSAICDCPKPADIALTQSMDEPGVSEAVTVLRGWLESTPLYEGDDARALHYERNVRVLRMALSRLTGVPFEQVPLVARREQG